MQYDILYIPSDIFLASLTGSLISLLYVCDISHSPEDALIQVTFY